MWTYGGVTVVEDELGTADVKALGCEAEVIGLGHHTCVGTPMRFQFYSRPPTLSPSDTADPVTATSPVLALFGVTPAMADTTTEAPAHVVANNATATTDYLGISGEMIAVRPRWGVHYCWPHATTMQLRQTDNGDGSGGSPLDYLVLLNRIHQLSRVPVALIVPSPHHLLVWLPPSSPLITACMVPWVSRAYWMCVKLELKPCPGSVQPSARPWLLSQVPKPKRPSRHSLCTIEQSQR
ncbi:hypothetical protein EDB85DRAFT_1900131 [Lactarius pseudohatsudake]|nr:hypothetical protein EDB85DRAFT_1900131 [Lactarius pseudohatsudake]